MAKPFFRSQKKTWYVHWQGKTISLGKDEKKAFAKWEALQRSQQAPESCLELLDDYYVFLLENRAATTADRRKPILKSFALAVGRLRVDQLTPRHVEKWVATYGGASPTYKNTLITAVKAAFSWGVKSGRLTVNPLANVIKPTPRVRQTFVPPSRWPELLGHCKGSFRDLVEFMLLTGARVEEVVKLEARHFDGARFILDIADSKGRKRSRVIYVPDQLLGKIPKEGYAFVNSRGKPWTRNSIRCRFRELKKVMNMPDLCATTLRHSFAHARLSAGQDSLTVSKLMGHVDLQMLARRYGHLDANVDLMRQAANAVGIPAEPQTLST